MGAENLEMEDLEEMRRECKFRVRVQEIVSASQMSRMSDYELKRVENINESLTLKYSIGLPMPDQKSLRAQLGINRRRFKPKVKVEDKEDFDWRPNQQRPKKEGPKAFTPAQITNRKVWVEDNLLVDENGDPAKPDDIKGFERIQK